ncbi:hypothetical protein IMSAGC006_01280 [Muribaculaceae bacterium]|nr:hypothetical protein IMSAGC006_01280 [Muribaculaceae bacterium]
MSISTDYPTICLFDMKRRRLLIATIIALLLSSVAIPSCSSMHGSWGIGGEYNGHHHHDNRPPKRHKPPKPPKKHKHHHKHHHCD